MEFRSVVTSKNGKVKAIKCLRKSHFNEEKEEKEKEKGTQNTIEIPMETIQFLPFATNTTLDLPKELRILLSRSIKKRRAKK